MKVVVLDRDGVINHDSDNYIKSEDEWVPIAGSIQAIADLCKAGYHVMVATNQSGLGRKLFDEHALARIHHKLRSMVEDAGGTVAGIFYCPHMPEQHCDCRKPGVGLLQQIEREFGCSLAGCYYVGDSYKDIQAASTFRCTPVLVRTGKGTETEKYIRRKGVSGIPVFENLADAVHQLLVNLDA